MLFLIPCCSEYNTLTGNISMRDAGRETICLALGLVINLHMKLEWEGCNQQRIVVGFRIGSPEGNRCCLPRIIPPGRPVLS